MSISKIAIALSCISVPLQAQEWIKHERPAVQPNGQSSASAGTFRTPSISDDVLWVVFESGQSDLVAGDTNGYRDVFVRDRATQTTRRINLGARYRTPVGESL